MAIHLVRIGRWLADEPLAQGRTTGGTWITGDRTLYDLLEANRRGELLLTPQMSNVNP